MLLTGAYQLPILSSCRPGYFLITYNNDKCAYTFQAQNPSAIIPESTTAPFSVVANNGAVIWTEDSPSYFQCTQ